MIQLVPSYIPIAFQDDVNFITSHIEFLLACYCNSSAIPILYASTRQVLSLFHYTLRSSATQAYPESLVPRSLIGRGGIPAVCTRLLRHDHPSHQSRCRPTCPWRTPARLLGACSSPDLAVGPYDLRTVKSAINGN